MSDIYLQITETPTVVTLSAPVVSGALASTVTVANTVTVALDSNSLSALENVTVTVGAAITGTVTVSNSVTISSLPAISGTVTANTNFEATPEEGGYAAKAIQIGFISDPNTDYFVAGGESYPFPVNIRNSVTIGSALPTGTNRIGVVTIGGGTVTIGAGTSQIGSVTISSLPAISGTVTANINTFPDATIIGEQIAQGFTNYGSFEVAIGGTANVSGTVTANTFAVQGTAVTISNFTSTTASTVLANFNATREVLTIFNEGAGNLHICAGATCTTIAYQVRLSAGDYYEVPNHQTTITHSAVFATAGTARVCQVS